MNYRKLVCLLLLCLLANGEAAIQASTPLQEISYYPRDYAWEKFWQQWPQAKVQMDEDLDKVKATGANTIRIFLHPSTFGYPQPSSTYLNYFEEALALINTHGLRAHVTLFDCWWSWSDIAGSQTWITGIVGTHQNDSRVAVWELQNEVALDQPVVRSWVQSLLPYLKQRSGNVATTVSVANVEWLDDVQTLTSPNTPDIYTLHWYPSDFSWTKPFPSVIERARQLIGPANLLVGEFGYSTYTLSETSQANLYRDMLYSAHQMGETNLGVWTLTDFPQGTTQCAGYIPPADQLYFGLYRADGSAKPALAILDSAFHGHPPTSLSPSIVLNSSFEDLNPYSGHVDNWRTWDQNWSGQQWFSQDCTTSYAGNCSVRLFGPGNLVVGLYHMPVLPVESGKTFDLNGYVRAQNLNGWARVSISWFDSNTQYLGSSISNDITATNSSAWELVSITDSVPPSSAAFFQVFAQMYSSDPSTSVWFDEVTNLVHHLYLPSIQK
jgi:hypothetical protein